MNRIKRFARMARRFRRLFHAVTLAALIIHGGRCAGADRQVTASSTITGFSANGAVDGNRFSTDEGSLWMSRGGDSWWQVRFPEPRQVGAILQIHGDHEFLHQHVPANYRWQHSHDGNTWHDFGETAVRNEPRLYRIHRLHRSVVTRYLRLAMDADPDTPAALREVEFFADPRAEIPFPAWVIAVNSAEDAELHGAATPFIDLIRTCDDWAATPAQVVWHGDFNEALLEVEPAPLCAFFSGSYLEWCQRSREPWRGVERVLKGRNLPIWASCGGAQAMLILDVTGADHAWDCPRCRDARNPLLPIYSHIGHTGHALCGDYSQNVAERGAFKMCQVEDDPAFADLPEVFEVMESHVGQIAFVPPGWKRIVTKGPGAHTENQCLRVHDLPIYAAQFHIEMLGTPENSRRIMRNFLNEAERFGGYRQASDD